MDSKCIQSKLHIKENEIGVVATWDSSAHGHSKLNRVTPDHEKIYIIVKVIVRLTDPSPIGNIFDNFINNIDIDSSFADLVLRKRICLNVFKRPSISHFFKKNLSSYLGKNTISQSRTGEKVKN